MTRYVNLWGVHDTPCFDNKRLSVCCHSCCDTHRQVSAQSLRSAPEPRHTHAHIPPDRTATQHFTIDDRLLVSCFMLVEKLSNLEMRDMMFPVPVYYLHARHIGRIYWRIYCEPGSRVLPRWRL